MAKGTHDDGLDGLLQGEYAAELLRDHRRKYKLPEGMITGSPEYWKWWREQNVLRNKLYQKRAYLKRRKIILATQQYEGHSAESIDAALKEIDEQLVSLRELRQQDADPPLATPRPVEVKKAEVPFIREMANLHKVSYAEAEKIMLADDYHGDESFTKDMSSRLEDIIGVPLDDVEKKG